jgi:two-component system, response regulator PdtaR
MAKILLAEDEALTALALQELLADYGHQVEIVSTGAKVLAAVAADPPEVILMDIGLAGPMNGLEAARQVRASNPIPIVFMTGYADKKYMDEAALLSKVYVTKPMGIEDVVKAIADVLSLPVPPA